MYVKTSKTTGELQKAFAYFEEKQSFKPVGHQLYFFPEKL